MKAWCNHSKLGLAAFLYIAVSLFLCCGAVLYFMTDCHEQGQEHWYEPGRSTAYHSRSEVTGAGIRKPGSAIQRCRAKLREFRLFICFSRNDNNL